MTRMQASRSVLQNIGFNLPRTLLLGAFVGFDGGWRCLSFLESFTLSGFQATNIECKWRNFGATAIIWLDACKTYCRALLSQGSRARRVQTTDAVRR